MYNWSCTVLTTFNPRKGFICKVVANHAFPFPTLGETLVLFIQLQGDFEGTLNEAILLSTDGDTIETLIITDIGNGGYTNTFVTPSQPFLLQIIGVSSSGNLISRISTTGVETTAEDIGIKQIFIPFYITVISESVIVSLQIC